MDLQLILRVVWRFRLLVACGVLLAVALSVMSYVKVGLTDGKPSFEYRQSEQWESLSTLFVTSRGFPWGSIDTQATGPLANQSGQAAGAQGAATSGSNGNAARQDGAAGASAAPTPLDPANLTALAGLYVQLATSDPVYRIMNFVPGRDGALQAFPVSSDPTGRGDSLPMVTLSAIAGSPQDAQKLAARHAEAFVTYLRREQRRAEIPESERVIVEVVRQPQAPTLLEGRKKTRPMVVFVAIMIAVLGLAFALENLRPWVRVLPSAQEPSSLEPVATEPVRSRRSA